MTEYIALQARLVVWLFLLQKHNPAVLPMLVTACKAFNLKPHEWIEYLRSLGFRMQHEAWHAEVQFGSLISEQLQVEKDGDIFIRNLLGKPLPDDSHQVIEIKSKRRRNPVYRLRTEHCANPRMLKVGDVLGTGESVISAPRQGAEGMILVHVSSSQGDLWLGFPAQMKIALRINEKATAAGVQ